MATRAIKADNLKVVEKFTDRYDYFKLSASFGLFSASICEI